MLQKVNELKLAKENSEKETNEWKEKFIHLQKTEASKLVDKAVSLGLLPEDLKDAQLLAPMGFKARAFHCWEGESCFKYADMRYRNLKIINAFFSTQILYDDRVAPTLTSSGESIYWHEKRNINDTEYRRMSTFPSDFDFGNAKVRYVCRMSVPPMMTAKIAEQIKLQWFESNNELNTS